MAPSPCAMTTPRSVTRSVGGRRRRKSPSSSTSRPPIGARSSSWRPSGRSSRSTSELLMNLDALGACLTTPACVVTQATSGLIVGMLLFLVAAGVTLIFGVLKIVNFAHGTFYMLGGYVAYTALGVTDSYALAVLSGTLAMALFGVLFERALISRVYGSNVLMQLLICYAVVLIFDDLVKIVWGPEVHAIGMPAAFPVP